MCITTEVQIDPLNHLLLACLAHNCRLSYATLGRIAKVSAHTVQARIQQLEEQGVIMRYVMIVDLRPLGFTRHHVLMRFSEAQSDIHVQCRKLAKFPAAVWVASYIGAFDAQVILDSHARIPIHELLRECFNCVQGGVSDYLVFTDEEDIEFKHHLPRMPLINLGSVSDEAAFLDLLPRGGMAAQQKVVPYHLSALELQILEALAREPRLGMGELAAQVGCDRVTARRNVVGLIRAKVILNFGASFNHIALGYHAYHLLFRLSPSAPRESIKRAFRNQPGVFYAGLVCGAYDLSVYLYAREPSEVMNWIAHIRKVLGKHINRYDLLLYDAVHHWRQVTDAAVGAVRGAD